MPDMRDLSAFHDLGGAIIDGKFRVERVLGQGGCGVVLLAIHVDLGERRALKFLHPTLTDDVSRRRFVREGRAAARLAGEHAVHVFDIGQHPELGPYLVMEFVDGSALDTLLAAGPLPISAAIDFVLQACTALAESHREGVIHRDLKPANLFVTRRPDGQRVVKVMDFGLAKWTFQASVTATNSMLGSPGYMAPEQARNARSVDARADIWSLGAVLYELIAGRRPFNGTSIAELVSQVLTEAPAPLPSSIPRGLRAAIERCMAREPSGRFSTVGELAAALVPFGGPDAARLGELVRRIEATPPARHEALGVAATLDVAGARPAAPLASAPRRRISIAAVATLVAIAVALAAAVVTKSVRHSARRRAFVAAPPSTFAEPAPPVPVPRPSMPPAPPAAAMPASPPVPLPSPPLVNSAAPPALRQRPSRGRRPLPPSALSTPPPPQDLRPTGVPGDLDGDGIPDVR